MVDERVAALVARGVAPIKPEYLCAVADARVAVPPLPSSEEPPEVAQRKSKKKMKRERKQQGGGGGEARICFNFARGCCTFDQQCRFGHDMQAYLHRRRPDLPGRCPFSEAGECPHGILCRWAGTHGPSDALSATHLRPAGAALASAAGASAATLGNASAAPAAALQETRAPASRPGTGPAERAGEPGAQAARAAAEEVVAGTLAARTGALDAAAAAASGETAAAPMQLEPACPGPDPAAAPAAAPSGAEGVPPERGQPAGGATDIAAGSTCNGGLGAGSEPGPGAACRAAEGAVALLGAAPGLPPGSEPAAPARRAPDGSIPPGVVALPLPGSTAAPLNQLDKDVQTLLRRSKYDFAAANAALRACGAKVSERYVQQAKGVPDPSPNPTLASAPNGASSAGPAEALPGVSGAGERPAKRHCVALAGAPEGSAAADAGAKGHAAPCAAPPHASGQAQGTDAALNGGLGDLESGGQGKAAVAGTSAELPEAPVQPGNGAGGRGSLAFGEAAAADASVEAPAPAVQPTDVAHGGPAAVEVDSGAGERTGAAQQAPAANGAVQHAPAGAADAEAALLYCAARSARAEAAAAYVEGKARPAEKRRLDLRGKLYLAPLTTVGNLPFRRAPLFSKSLSWRKKSLSWRVCKGLGADVTCGEMALATNLLQGQGSEWALLKRDLCEDLFGVQICGGYPDALTHCAQLIEEHVTVDFVDINMGCPIDIVCNRNAGSALLTKPARVEQIVRSVSSVLSCPLTIKVRKGYNDGADVVHKWLPRAASWGAAAATIHGRTRQQRYSKVADWAYIRACAQATAGALPLIGNGDVVSFEDFHAHLEAAPELATIMLARGALVKPWIFTEIKERRHWDISASERLDLLKAFCSAGLVHWGSDSRGVETTRHALPLLEASLRFLLEWLSFLHRYVPVGLLEVLPQRLNWRPPAFFGRSDLETWLASDNPKDWLRISEMLLGPAPAGFAFAPKHKSASYSSSEGAMAFEGADNG